MAAQRKQLGERIAQARKDRRWKQKELAAAVHVEPTTVSRWETGRHAPDIDVLEQVARALDRPLSYFVDDASTNLNGSGEARWQREIRDEIRRGFEQLNAKVDRIAEGQRVAASSSRARR